MIFYFILFISKQPQSHNWGAYVKFLSDNHHHQNKAAHMIKKTHDFVSISCILLGIQIAISI